jgi:transcriptional regulator with XRE-family HTH domain
MPARRNTPLSDAIDRQLYIIGMTRADFAKAIGVGYNYLSNILIGHYEPSIDLSNRMAGILEMNPREVRELVLKKAI